MISPVPDIRTLDLDPKHDSFVFLACDGIWNSLSSQEVADFISKRLEKAETATPDVLKSICIEVGSLSCLVRGSVALCTYVKIRRKSLSCSFSSLKPTTLGTYTLGFDP
jgi:hypothetical protein